MNGQRNHLQTLFASTAKSMSHPIPHEMLVTRSGRDSDDDYRGLGLNTSEPASATTAATDVAVAGASAFSSVSMNNATKCELEALQYLDDSRKDLVMLNCYPTIKQLFFCVSTQFYHLRHL
jgi:hypothetical protein